MISRNTFLLMWMALIIFSIGCGSGSADPPVRFIEGVVQSVKVSPFPDSAYVKAAGTEVLDRRLNDVTTHILFEDGRSFHFDGISPQAMLEGRYVRIYWNYATLMRGMFNICQGCARIDSAYAESTIPEIPEGFGQPPSVETGAEHN